MAGSTTMVQAGRHRLAATVLGSGTPTVVIEPAFGGCAEDWLAIARRLSGQATVVCYDRAPYGKSSPATDRRTPGEIADDLHDMLAGLGVRGPLVLVGHSAGGIYLRAYAARHLDEVAGMVFVDSSHEAQARVLKPLYPWRVRLDGMLAIPQIMAESDTARHGGDRRSIVREWRAIQRVIKSSPPLPAEGLGDRPLAVLTCAPSDPASPDPSWRAWHDLHRDLARLSRNSRHIVSDSPHHYLNQRDPDLVASAIADVVRCTRDGARLTACAAGTGVRGVVPPEDRASGTVAQPPGAPPGGYGGSSPRKKAATVRSG